jgi:CheY-like chemotaxis protein/anti-sigma regulatory factor (Ser/Thr protein kinase)
MSHELRTPLNSIIGFTQLLARGDLPPSEKEFVVLIERAGQHLVKLINDVLDVAGIEAGKLTLSIEPVDVQDAVAQAVDLVSVMAKASQVRLLLSNSTEARWVLADSQRLAQILLNLLSNAIRYNHQGGTVTIEVADDGERVQIAVHDTGSGIPAELLPRVFEPFERLGAEQTGIEGSGMGLSVSKGLAGEMHGDITATSTPSTGSTFTVILPMATPNANPPLPGSSDRAASTDQPTLKVLYIEDNNANLLLMEHALGAKPGTSMRAARTGQAGLDVLASEEVDVAMIDLHLPDMDGTEVLRRIRQDRSTADLTVVIVSADAMADRIAQLRAQGADYYLTKPIDLNELYATLDRIRSKRAAT